MKILSKLTTTPGMLALSLAMTTSPATAQQSNAWIEAGMKAIWAEPVDGGSWIGWNDYADAMAGGKTKNKNGGAAGFTGSHAGADAHTLGNWTVKDGGAVPSYGYEDWRKFPAGGGRLMSARMDVNDAADNTRTYARGWWNSTVTAGAFWKSYDWKGWVSAAITKPDPDKGLGTGRAAARAQDPLIFQLTESLLFNLDIVIDEIEMGVLSGADCFGELNWHAAFGSGDVVGENVMFGSMTTTAVKDGVTYAVGTGETLTNSSGFSVLSVNTTLQPGFYWFDAGLDGQLEAVPEPATLAALGFGTAMLLRRRRRR